MKQAILLGSFLVFAQQIAFSQLTLLKNTEIDPPTKVSLDQSGNIYLATYDGGIIKYSPDFTNEQIFSPSVPNSTTALEAWQGLRIFTFHKELQLYRLINRNLSLSEDYSFAPDLVGFAEIATMAFDNNIWVVDQTDFSLKKINIHRQAVDSATPLNLLIDPDDYEILHCKEYQNRLFISTRGKGILIFDNFGTYLKTFNYPGIGYFNFYNDDVYFIQDNKLVSINLYEETITSIDLPSDEKWLFALIFEKSTYLFSNKYLNLYQ